MSEEVRSREPRAPDAARCAGTLAPSSASRGERQRFPKFFSLDFDFRLLLPLTTVTKMAKKTRDDVPNPNSVSNRDILQRLNFLYQASALLSMVDMPPQPMAPPIPATLKGKERKEEKRRRNRERHSITPADLSRTYVRSMRAIGQKTNMRMCVIYS